jgi:hypothetical protein
MSEHAKTAFVSHFQSDSQAACIGYKAFTGTNAQRKILTTSLLFDPKHEKRGELLPQVTLQLPSKSAPVRPRNVSTLAPLSPFDRKKLLRAMPKRLPLSDDFDDTLILNWLCF